MSHKTFETAIKDRRFTGNMRLTYIAIGDGSGLVSIDLIRHWVNCDGATAVTLQSAMLEMGILEVAPNGELYCDDLLEDYIRQELFRVEPEFTPEKDRRQPTKKLRDLVFQTRGEVCAYCGTTNGPFHVDHIYPFSRGGKTVLANLTIACAPCNIKKGSRTPEEWADACE